LGNEIEPQTLNGQHYGDGDHLPTRRGLGAAVVLLVLLFGGLAVSRPFFCAVHDSFSKLVSEIENEELQPIEV
jgi:hypothetical protein